MKWGLAGAGTGSSSRFYIFSDFPGGARGKEPACQCRGHKRLGFDPWVRREDSLLKEMAIHSSILAWRILWTEEPGVKRRRGESDTTEET